MSTIILALILLTPVQTTATTFPLPSRSFTETVASSLREQQADRTGKARAILMKAKDELAGGNITFLRNHLSDRVYLSLLDGTNGYYSREQAFIILTSFFTSWKPISFSFSSRNFSIANPYGFGPLNYERRGRRRLAELFLSLTYTDERWHISQITVSAR